jgi:hypothetical protein
VQAHVTEEDEQNTREKWFLSTSPNIHRHKVKSTVCLRSHQPTGYAYPPIIKVIQDYLFYYKGS